MRLLARLLDPSEGRIVFDGQDLAAIAARRFAARPERARIQMVFQDAGDSLNPRGTARDAIRGPCRLLLGLSTARADVRVDEVAAQVGLAPEWLQRYPHQLPGGQKARVGIARALALSPQLLILDEPTAALDVRVQAVVLQLLEALLSAIPGTGPPGHEAACHVARWLPDGARTRRVVAMIRGEGSCWCGVTGWQGRTALRINVRSWAATADDVERSLAAMLAVADRRHPA